MLALAARMWLACPSPDPSSLHRVQRGSLSYIGAPQYVAKIHEASKQVSRRSLPLQYHIAVFSTLPLDGSWQPSCPCPLRLLPLTTFAMLLLAMLILALAILALTARLVQLGHLSLAALVPCHSAKLR